MVTVLAENIYRIVYL